MADVRSGGQKGGVAEAELDFFAQVPEGLVAIAGYVSWLEVGVMKAHDVQAVPVTSMVIDSLANTQSQGGYIVAVDFLSGIGIGQVVGVERQIEFGLPFLPNGFKPLDNTVVPGGGRCKFLGSGRTSRHYGGQAAGQEMREGAEGEVGHDVSAGNGGRRLIRWPSRASRRRHCCIEKVGFPVV